MSFKTQHFIQQCCKSDQKQLWTTCALCEYPMVTFIKMNPYSAILLSTRLGRHVTFLKVVKIIIKMLSKQGFALCMFKTLKPKKINPSITWS